MRETHKGRFRPLNPQKYKGDPKNIIYRSGWEVRLMSYLDKNDAVLEWASEEFSIPYFDPTSQKIRRYFPDFWVKAKKKDGSVKIMVIEVKPHKQTYQPEPTKNRRRMIAEQKTWLVNEAKWKSAVAFCNERGWEFRLVTENDLNIR
jgi:TnsA endonuclease N terminal